MSRGGDGAVVWSRPDGLSHLYRFVPPLTIGFPVILVKSDMQRQEDQISMKIERCPGREVSVPPMDRCMEDHVILPLSLY